MAGSAQLLKVFYYYREKFLPPFCLAFGYYYIVLSTEHIDFEDTEVEGDGVRDRVQTVPIFCQKYKARKIGRPEFRMLACRVKMGRISEASQLGMMWLSLTCSNIVCACQPLHMMPTLLVADIIRDFHLTGR